MKKRPMAVTKNISFSFLEFDNADELPASDRELILTAVSAAGLAYAPYSKFRVGAAVRLESGKIVHGSNVENAAFPSGLCAERTALAAAVSNFPDDRPLAIAITAIAENGDIAESVSPCGNCRQVIAEEETRRGSQIRIILYMKNKIRVIESISLLLPLQFNMNNLRLDPPSR
jgi:cytidine deaminase